MTTIGKLIIGIFILATLLLLLFFSKKINSSGDSINLVYMPSPSVVPSLAPKVSSLDLVVENALLGTNGSDSVYIKNLKNGESYAKEETKSYQAGSLYKLWLLGPVFNLINSEKLALSDELSDNVGNLNRKYGVDSALTELPETDTIGMTVNDAITQMITISHNYAAMLLLDKLGRTTINSYIKSIGLIDSGLLDLPYTTALDTSLFFEKLYKGEILDEVSSSKMLEILKQQTFNDGLPKYLPKNVVVAHKTGDIDMFKHDCGIVFSPKSDYIICILSESEFPSGAQERIAQVSKAVYDYFQTN